MTVNHLSSQAARLHPPKSCGLSTCLSCYPTAVSWFSPPFKAVVSQCWLVLSSELPLISHLISKSITVIFHQRFSYEWEISVPLPSVSVCGWLVPPHLPYKQTYIQVLHQGLINLLKLVSSLFSVLAPCTRKAPKQHFLPPFFSGRHSGRVLR